jgi:hypothetical protein
MYLKSPSTKCWGFFSVCNLSNFNSYNILLTKIKLFIIKNFIGKIMTVSEELYKMKMLAGLATESDSNYTQSNLTAGVGMILKLGSSKKSEVGKIEIPQEPNGVDMTKLPSNLLHITLTSIKALDILKNKDLSIPIFVQNIKYYISIPDIEFGEAKFIYRDENGNRVYSPGGKVTYVVAIKNQDDIRNYVNDIYNELGLKNPEPNRFYHITLANNMGGDSFKSIGSVDEKDFK